MTIDIVSAQRELFNPAVLNLNEIHRAAQISEKEGVVVTEENYTHGVFNLSNNKYHSLPGISRSALMDFIESPLIYWDKYLNKDKPKKEITQNMRIGTAVHCLVLEPEIFKEEIALLGDYNARSKDGRQYKSDFEKENAQRTILNKKEYEQAKIIAKSISDYQHTKDFLIGSFEVEKSIFWTDAETGLLCKARPDIWQQGLGLICDIKTSSDAAGFKYSIVKYGYHIQAAMQIDGILATTGQSIDAFNFIVGPTDRPFKPYLHVLNQSLIEKGRDDYKNALKILKKCIETQKWDLDREKAIIQEDEEIRYQLSLKPLRNLMEIYQCQAN